MKRQGWIALACLAPMMMSCNLFREEPPTIGPRTRTSPLLYSFQTCDELSGRLRDNLSEEMRVQLLSADHYYWGGMGMEDAAQGAPSDGGNGGGRQEGVDYSGTNNQEQGVDEADFVKTDGYHVYVLNGSRLEILGVPEFGELTRVSTTPIEGYPGQMLIGDDKVVVFSYIYTWNLPETHPLRGFIGAEQDDYGWWYRSQSLTKITVVDITDRAVPVVQREVYLEGNYQTARKVASSVRMVSYAWIDVPGLRYWPELSDAYYELDYEDPRRQELWDNAIRETINANDRLIYGTPLGDFVPRLFERFPSGNLAEYPLTDSGCAGFAIAEDGMSRGFSSIFSMDLLGPVFAFDADHIVSNWSTVYASTDTLLLAAPSQDWWWYWRNTDFEEATDVHRFDISQPGVTTYTGSGRVDGTIRNQFSLSEHQGYVRMATTTNQWTWWQEEPEEPENHVYVLGGQDALQTIGHVGGIAIGERIWSSRFIGDRGFLVTFRNIDPLWTIDLSDPADPRVIGELEVPGVSTYIHPMEGGKLLTIGYGGDEEGLDWATQVSLFDVGDFAQPLLDSALSLAPEVEGEGWTYAWSEANWEHKAFQYWGPMSMLAIPLSTYRSSMDYSGYEYASLLQLITVDLEAGLSRYGQIDHSHFFNSDPERYWDWRDVRRSIFMGDFIYAISDRGVSVHRLADLTLMTSVALPGTDYNELYWVD